MNSRGDQLNGRTRKLLDMVDILLAIKVFIVDAMGLSLRILKENVQCTLNSQRARVKMEIVTIHVLGYGIHV